MKTSLYVTLLCLFIMTTPVLAAEWNDPVLLSELNDGANNAYRPCVSRDGLSIYYGRQEYGHWKLWQSSRSSLNDPFSNEVELSELYDGRRLYYVWVNGDQSKLYYTQHDNVYQNALIWQAERSSPSDPWEDVLSFTDIHNPGDYDAQPSLTADELTLFYFKSDGRIYSATRSSVDDQFQNPVLYSELNDGSNTAAAPCIMPDGLTIYFSATQTGQATSDIYKATRSSLSDIFGNIERLEFCSDSINEYYPHVLPDGQSVYYYNGDGIWQVTEVPEPATFGLFALGGLLLRKKKRT